MQKYTIKFGYSLLFIKIKKSEYIYFVFIEIKKTRNLF